MLTLISRWFEPVSVSKGYGRVECIILALILAAGILLRFWNLDNVGLHGDEDIMGLAARGILAHGIPILPSEMVYARAPLHTYLMAASMYVFGDNEWAIRFPSALAGSLAPLCACYMGRRFLSPTFNLSFAALIAFVPAMIEISQTGRMYVFLVVFLLIFGALLFRWEETGGWGAYLNSILALFFALQFHALAVFAAPLLLFPGLSRQSWQSLAQGAVAMIVVLIAHFLSSNWISQHYPSESEYLPKPMDTSADPLELLAQGPWLFVAVLGLIAIGVLAYFGFRALKQIPALLPAVVLLGLGLTSCALLHYHIGGILLLLGAIGWLRVRPGSNVGIIVVATVVAAIVAVQIGYLSSTGEYSGRQVIGAMVGTPSVWPVLRFTSLSPVGAIAMLVALGVAAYRFTLGHRMPVHLLFFAIAVWAPLLAIGIFKWDVPLRYMLGVAPFFLLGLMAGVSYVVERTYWVERIDLGPIWLGIATSFLIAAFVNPIAMLRMAGNDYRTHPDHKGAAEFVRALGPGPDDILIAEDSIVQTYYLGKVNYRLQGIDRARNHSVLVNGVLRGQYTGTPVMGSGEELEALIQRTDLKGQVYIIGSGENFRNGRRSIMRSNGIEQALESQQLEVIYEGRDRKTKIWRRR